MLDLKVVNIKLSLKIVGISYQHVIERTINLQQKRRLNFIVIFNNYTYTIFKPTVSTGHLHCNITKIRGFEDICKAIEILFAVFPGAELEPYKVDNLTATTVCDTKENLDQVFTNLNFKYRIKYNLQKFPALFIKYPAVKSYATVFIFSSGKVVCVGAKSQDQLKVISEWLKTEINIK